jgi:hypothetical protein
MMWDSRRQLSTGRVLGSGSSSRSAVGAGAGRVELPGASRQEKCGQQPLACKEGKKTLFEVSHRGEATGGQLRV